MKALYLVPDAIDPPNSGSRIRALGIRTGLDAVGSVVVASLDETHRDDAWGAMCRSMVQRRAALGRRVADRFSATVKGTPALLERAIAAGAREAFEALVLEYRPDLVVLSRPCFGPFIDLAQRHGAKVVVDADESLVRAMGSVAGSRASTYQRIRAALDGVNARRFERREYARVDQVWVSSPVEERYFRRLLPGRDVREIPNLAPRTNAPVEDLAVNGIAFVGTYSYAPNEEAAFELMRAILPAARAAGLDLPLSIVGREPTKAMEREAAKSFGIKITGLVDDPVANLRAAGVTVIPIRSGAGSRIKILEAMAAGVPVISTKKGFEGLAVRPDVEMLHAETPVEFVRCLQRLRSDAALRRRLVSAAAAFVKARHGQAAVTDAVVVATRMLLPA